MTLQVTLRKQVKRAIGFLRAQPIRHEFNAASITPVDAPRVVDVPQVAAAPQAAGASLTGEASPRVASRREGNAEITEQALKKRTFKIEVYKQLCETTILSKLAPFLEKADVAIDVGGNVGHIAYFLSQHSGRVYSFEAVRAVYEQLEKVRALAPNIQVENCAIADFCGTAELFIDHNRLSNSGLHNVGGIEVSFKPKTEFKTAQTQVKSIDSLGIEPVDFIKIDVEGSELDVLKGAADTIDRFHPDLLVEIYLPFCKVPPKEIFDFLFARDYRCYYYDNTTRELVRVANSDAGIDAVTHHHAVHDGDFLFTRKNAELLTANG